MERKGLEQTAPFIKKTRRIFYNHDPIGLRPCPEDEYEPERASICRQLRKCKSIIAVQAVVHKEFVHWFGARLAGPPQRYHKLSEDLFNLFRGRKGKNHAGPKKARKAKASKRKPSKKAAKKRPARKKTRRK